MESIAKLLADLGWSDLKAWGALTRSALHIEIPYTHLTVYAGQDKGGSAPPFRVAQAPGGRP